MQTQSLLATLSGLNVKLEVRDGKLHVNAPAGVLTPELQQAIALQKNALIEMLQSAHSVPREKDLPQIIPDTAGRYHAFPLTDVQHAYWIGRNAQIQLGSVSTHIYFELECDALEPARLTASFQKVLNLHDMLRAVIDENGQQQVLETVPAYEIKVSDFRDAGPEQCDEELLRIRAEMSHQSFACNRWPLFDIRLVRITDQQSRLCVSWDFLMVDGWSLMLIFRQWFGYYRDPACQVASPSLFFRDYVLAEAGLKKQPAYQLSKNYWWDRLDQLPQAPQLPVSNITRSGKHEFRRKRLHLAAAQWDIIKTRARRSGLTPTSVLLAAFSQVLALWSGGSRYCLNLTLFNRLPLHDEVTAIVGDFTNLMALEIDMEKRCSFTELAARIQAQFLKDYDHRHVSALEVLRELARRRGWQQALLPVVFTSTLMLDGKRNDDAGVLERFGRMGYGISQTPQVWLDYQVFEVNGDLVINWDAVEEVFLPGVLDDMFESHRELLHLLMRAPDAWAQRDLALLPEIQRKTRELVNQTSAEVVNKCLHELFIHSAMESPDRTALIYSSGVMRYGELLAHSTLIAEQLIAAGVRPGELVAIVMHKGWEQVVSAMGVLIAGAAYLPVEPHWPALRRNYVLEQAEVRISLTQPALNRELEWPSNIDRIEVTKQKSLKIPTVAPHIRQSVEDLAYVIFTSGSTGVPKGVMISHLGAVNTIVHLNRMFGIGAEDKVLAVSELTFDLSVYDLFGTLGTGATIVIPDTADSRNAGHWEDLIREHSVTVWNSAPPLMGMLVDEWESDPARNLSSLRLVFLSGDWIPVPLPDRIRRMSPSARVISLGGATEGSIWSIYYAVEALAPHWDSIPYGKALPNQHMYVLDKALRPCPDLVKGDIYIGGVGVALGYWKDQEKTARQFLLHPETGERLYYTGDLGRIQRDGNIEFLGRADSQVKLRGYRVELGEITTCLQSHPAVRAAAVKVLKQDQRTLLTAYVVANQTGSTDPPENKEVSSPAPLVFASQVEMAAKHYIYIKDADEEALSRFWQFWKEVERASICAMLETLQALGILNGQPVSAALDHLVGTKRILPQYRRLILHWLAALTHWGHLTARDGGYTVSSRDISTGESVEGQLLALDQSFGADKDLKGFVEHVAGCLRNHLSLLCGELSPLELLFPQGSWHIAESLYELNPVVRYHNGLLAAIVSGLVENRESDRALRVLEIGAGTGGTSVAVLPSLPAQTEYTYTDVSAYFFNAAKTKFKAYPFIRYSVYDLNKDPGDQGYQLHNYDLIIAANVLHNAFDATAALIRVRDLLQPGGHLLLLEGTLSTPWMWATVAFLEDSRVESDQWALGIGDWSQVLASAGFEQVQIFPGGEEHKCSEFLAAMPQHVIAAQAPLRVTSLQPEELAAFLRERLPDHMVPQRFVFLDKLPLTGNGKVDLAALPADLAFSGAEAGRILSPRSDAEEQILGIWKDVLGAEHLSVTDNFFEIGGDSLLITQVMRRLNRLRKSRLTIAELLSYPTIRSLADYLSPQDTRQTESFTTAHHVEQPGKKSANDIAIIGMAARVPGADDVEQLWSNIAAGKCAVRNFSDEELLQAGVAPEQLADPNYVKAGFVLNNIDLFDALFFGVTPREAEIMDPQQRFLLECAVEALDNAGYASEKYAGRIGVFAGKGTSLYLLEHLLPRMEIVRQFGMLPILNVNEKDYAATLVSYKLNLTGPSLNVNTACSTSLTAVHLACESLLNRECEIALAGGVSFVSLQNEGYLYEEGHIMSPDGICRAFSEDANGTVFGSGVGLVVLKPLDSALRDGDTIHAVIKGSAINNDGALKLSYNAPSLHGQTEAIANAQARAGINPDTIQMLEAHGTGTALGDPIEFGALRKVFGGPRPDGTRCSLGSVKTNIGHLDTAAGIAGLVKVVQALKHKQIPPTLHVSRATSKVEFADSPFELTSVLKNWAAGAAPRRAGVSSFGVGGTNAHVVLEEAPVAEKRTSVDRPEILPVSAKSALALRRTMLALAETFGSKPDLSLEDVAFTLQVGRNGYSNRGYIVCDRLSDAREQFANPERLVTQQQNEGLTPAVVFLFPGQGSLHKNATCELYQNEPRFKSALDECAEIVQQYIGEDLRGCLYDKHQPVVGKSTAEELIEQTAITQPLLFSVEYALARFWESLGVRPAAMLGHSLGEYVAACIAGVFSLPEALSLMVVRGRLIQSLEPGRMLAVSCGEAQLREFLEGSMCSLAVVNDSSQCVASGPSAEITALQAQLRARGISSSRLRTSHAFHSHMVEPILQTFENCVAQVERHAPVIPFVSNVTGRWITDAEAISPAYWARHLRETVRFSDGLQQVIAIKNRVLLEVGPGRILTALARRTDHSRPAIASLEGESGLQSEWLSFLKSVGQLWLHGVEPDWMALHEGRQPGRVALPSYAFDRKRYWIEKRANLFSAHLTVFAPGKAAEPEIQIADVPVRPGVFPEVTESVAPHAAVAPIEARLLEIWKSYIGIPDIGVRDSFFEVGGDSLLAARIHSQIRREFDIELPLIRMFELETIRRVSLYIAISRDPGLIDTLPEQDLDEVLKVLESWPAGMRAGVAKPATTN